MSSSISDRRRVVVVLCSTVAIIFMAEMLLELLLSRLPARSMWIGALLAATGLSILTFPAVYFFALRPIGTHGAQHRLDERALAVSESSLSEAAVKYQSIFEHALHGIYQSTPDGRFITANPALARILGYDSVEELMDPATDAAGRLYACGTSGRAEFLRMLARQDANGGCEFETSRRDGTRLWISEHARAVQDADGILAYYEGTLSDITDRMRNEERLRELEGQFLRTQRLESIGLLAGGIAHDLNNVLSPIMMAVDLLKLSATEDNRSLLETIRSSTQRGSDMVKGVLSFARGLEGRRVDMEVRHLFREIEAIVRETFPKNIQLRATTTQDLWAVAGDPTELHQVLLNLCINARDAMPAGGKISITARNVTFDVQDAAMHVEAAPGPYVMIQVNDVGTGIPPSIIDKIFDPFFTTKEVGKGTGLGLSTSLTIVKGHGGFVRVASAAGSGTEFQIYLPAVPKGHDAQTEAERSELPRGNGELILIVDDEAAVREITRQTLEAFGYRVFLAAHGVEALASYAQHAGEIAVVVTDLLMPIMDGASTIRALKRLNPAVRIIAVSGSNDRVISAALPEIESGVIPVLPKPYTPEALLQALRQAIVGERTTQSIGP